MGVKVHLALPDKQGDKSERIRLPFLPLEPRKSGQYCVDALCATKTKTERKKGIQVPCDSSPFKRQNEVVDMHFTMRSSGRKLNDEIRESLHP